MPNPLPLRWAALTAALTVIFNEINPATAESVAPTANAKPFENPIKNPIMTESAIAIGIIIFISLLRNAAAPTLTAFEISIISLVPEGCFVIQVTIPRATMKEAIPAPIGKICCTSML